MLDKSIPYYSIIMLRQAGTPVPQAALPEGFSFGTFAPGMERSWAAIEASVGEFETASDALEYFQKEYMPYAKELEQRALFVRTNKDNEVATMTGWWNDTGDRRIPSVHWVAVKPEYQGCGLGKALVFEGLRRLIELEGDKDIYLHTQTWSCKAIGIYLQAGFKFLEKGSFGKYDNEYEKALPVLKEKMSFSSDHWQG